MADKPWTWPSSRLPLSYFPNLTFGKNANHRRRSWFTKRYNCIAWAADDFEQAWWPCAPRDAYWPPTAINAETREAFISAFGTLGYRECPDKSFEPGYEKVAIYFDSKGIPAHAARQLTNGKWTSKLGDFPDIEHNQPEDVNCLDYGSAGCYLIRERNRFNKPFWLRMQRRGRFVVYWLIYFWKSAYYGKWLIPSR